MDLEEASTSFDLQDLQPFLERVARLLDAGFTDREILEIKRLAEVMALDAEETLEFPVKYRGRTIPLRITIFMDDLAAPDVYFFTDPGLAQEINREMQQFAEEQGV